MYFVLSSAKREGRSKESGGSDRPDIHQTALLPFKLRKRESENKHPEYGLAGLKLGLIGGF